MNEYRRNSLWPISKYSRVHSKLESGVLLMFCLFLSIVLIVLFICIFCLCVCVFFFKGGVDNKSSLSGAGHSNLPATPDVSPVMWGIAITWRPSSSSSSSSVNFSNLLHCSNPGSVGAKLSRNIHWIILLKVYVFCWSEVHRRNKKLMGVKNGVVCF